MIQLTVLTATYNRAYIISKLYKSLCRQTDNNFIWVIVDDGSKDGTQEMVKEWKKENKINIKYIYQSNGGKHSAINNGVNSIDTEYVFMVDSDDYLVDNAIEHIHSWLKEIKDITHVGVSGCRGNYVNGELKILGQFPKGIDFIVCSNLERRNKKLLGDKAEVYRTEILRKYPFPIYKNEKFCPEDVVFNKIALDGYKIQWHKKILTVCEYLQDGLTFSMGQEMFEQNYLGYCDSFKLYWKGLKFPYNYSSASEFVKKSKTMGKKRNEIREVLEISYFKYLTVYLFGKVRKLLEVVK